MAILIRQAARIPQRGLDDLGPVEVPLSSPPSRLLGKKFNVDRPGVRVMGIWECSPGRWQRTIMDEEFAHFISGSARFIPEVGEPIDIHAGDAIWFPPNSRGVWEITETVRKVYVVIYRRSLLRSLRNRVAGILWSLGLRKGLPPNLHSNAFAAASECLVGDAVDGSSGATNAAA